MANGVKGSKLLGALYLILVHGALLWLIADKYYWRDRADVVPVNALAVGPQVTPAVLPSITPSPDPDPTTVPATVPAAAPIEAAPGRLIIPVAGIRPEQLTDTFTDSRSKGRSHDAIDIMAPGGTPVIAAADGEIVKFHDSEAGGITTYQISTDKKYFYYYAHLQARAPGIAEKQFVKQGTLIGYVGDTGNAGAGNTHLHFAINTVADPAKWWEGDNINPYPILTGAARLQ